MAPLNPDMRIALETQAAFERFNMNTYLEIANFWDALNYGGIAEYFRAESESEKKHMLAIMDYVTKRNRLCRVRYLHQMQCPPEIAEFTRTLAAATDAADAEEDYGVHFPKLFELAYKLECFNTKRLNVLSRQALDMDDHATVEALLYFHKEQAEAEDETDTWMSKAKAYGALPGLYWHLDAEMKKHAKIGAHPPTLNFTGLYQ